MDTRQRKETIQLIEEYLAGYSNDNQYNVSNIPFHAHNGVDTTRIQYSDIAGVPVVIWDWQFDGVFSPSSNTVVAWTAGNLITSAGDSYSISAGSTGTMSNVTYIYLDTSISDTALQVASASSGVSSTATAFYIGRSADGQYLFTTGNTTTRYNTDFDILYANSAITGIFSFAIDSTNTFVYATTSTTLYKLNFSDFSIVTSVAKNHTSTVPIFISPDNNFIYLADTTNAELHKYSTADLSEPVAFVVVGSIITLAVSPDSATLYVVTNTQLRKFTASTLVAGSSVSLTQSGGVGVAISSTGTRLYVISSANHIEKFDNSLSSLANASVGANPGVISISPDNNYVYVTANGGSAGTNWLVKINTSDLSNAASVNTSGVGSQGPDFNVVSLDGSYIFVMYQSFLRKFNASDLSLVAFAPTVVGPGKILVAVAQNVASGKNAIFEIFSGNALNGSGKIITSADMNGILTNITTLGLRDTSAAFDVTITATSSPALSAARTLTIDMSNVAHTLDFGTTANTITFPSVASDTVVMLAASQAIVGKTYNGLTVSTTTGTFTLTNGKTLTVSDSTTLATNSITFAGGEVVTFTATNALTLTTTGSTNITFPTSGTLYGTASGSITSAQLAASLTDETGSGLVVFQTSPTIITPTIAKLANLTTNGFVKTSGGDGTLSVDTSTYNPRTDTRSLTGQVADIGSTNLTISGTGLYLIAYYLVDTVADLTAGTVTVSFAYTDSGASQTQNSASVLLTTLGSFTQGEFVIQSASGNISYSTSHTGIFGTAAYNLYLSLEKIN